MAVKFRVHQFVDAAQVKRDVSFSLADLTGAMVDHSGMLVHYGDLAAKASKQVDDLELLIDVAEAKVYRKVRDEVAASGEKVTEALLSKLVTTHEDVVSLRKALNEAKQIEANAKIAVEAFRHRKDLLIQQGVQAREERKGEVLVAARDAAEATRKALGDSVADRLANHR